MVCGRRTRPRLGGQGWPGGSHLRPPGSAGQGQGPPPLAPRTDRYARRRWCSPGDGEDRRGEGAHQRQGVHALLVRPRHPDQVELHRGLRRLPGAGDRNPSAGPGATGTLGTIKRSDGTTPATYNAHPLYTYAGDTAPGQAFGNNLNLNGGLWHEVTLPG